MANYDRMMFRDGEFIFECDSQRSCYNTVAELYGSVEAQRFMRKHDKLMDALSRPLTQEQIDLAYRIACSGR